MPRFDSYLHDPDGGFNHPMRSVRGTTLGCCTLGDDFTQPTAGFRMPWPRRYGSLADAGLLDWLTGGKINPADPAIQTSASGDTAITAADFAQSGGVCKPRNLVALNYTKELQKQLNRVAHVKGFSKISVDGSIGPATQSLLKKVQAVAPQVMGTPASCIGVAADADVIGDQVREVANALAAPATVPGPLLGSGASQLALPNGKVGTVTGTGDGVMGAFTSLGETEKIVMVGLVGGIGYMLWKGKKRRK